MELKTDRLILRPLCVEDLDTLHESKSNAETMKYANPPHTDIKETAEYLEWVTEQWQSDHQTYFSFGIMLGDKLIGEIGFSSGCGKCGRCVKGEVAVGYGIHQDFQNYGYESEAVNAIIEHSFSTLNAEKIKMSCDIESLSELRLIESLGMELILKNEDCEYNDGKSFKRNTYILKKYYSK